MRELLGEQQQLAVRNLEVLSGSGRCRRCGPRTVTALRHGRSHYRLDFDRDATQLLNLSDGDGAIGAIHDALDESPFGIASAIGKLGHTRGNSNSKLANRKPPRVVTDNSGFYTGFLARANVADSGTALPPIDGMDPSDPTYTGSRCEFVR